METLVKQCVVLSREETSAIACQAVVNIVGRSGMEAEVLFDDEKIQSDISGLTLDEWNILMDALGGERCASGEEYGCLPDDLTMILVSKKLPFLIESVISDGHNRVLIGPNLTAGQRPEKEIY